MQAVSSTLQFTAKTICAVAAVSIAVSALSLAQNSEPFQLIYESQIDEDSNTELTGSIILRCRDSNTSEHQDIRNISFFLNRSSAADPSLRERGDITVVENGNNGIKFNLTRRLEGNYTCGRRVDAANVRESLPVTLICKWYNLLYGLQIFTPCACARGKVIGLYVCCCRQHWCHCRQHENR